MNVNKIEKWAIEQWLMIPEDSRFWRGYELALMDLLRELGWKILEY